MLELPRLEVPTLMMTVDLNNDTYYIFLNLGWIILDYLLQIIVLIFVFFILMKHSLMILNNFLHLIKLKASKFIFGNVIKQ